MKTIATIFILLVLLATVVGAALSPFWLVCLMAPVNGWVGWTLGEALCDVWETRETVKS